jgi:transglutaminase-like putative cysteine protease
MTHVSFSTIPWGDHGVEQTLNLMADMVSAAVDVPVVVYTARRLAVMGGVRNEVGQANTIRAWLASVWRFVDDPRDRELLVTPDELLQSFERDGVIAGDCDEAAVLGAALAKAVGFQVCLYALAFPDDNPQGDKFQHVYAAILTDDGLEVSLDVTRPRGPVPTVTRIMQVEA